MTGRPDLAFAQELARSSAIASLATLDPQGGPPHASLVTVAASQDLAPILLLSDLALHRKNIAGDPAVALLLTGEGQGAVPHADPLAGDRVTLRGMVAKSTAPEDRGRFLARHPAAAEYADFGDFNFFRMQVTSAHLVGGFGRIKTYPGADWTPDTEAMHAVIAAESDIVDHMNEDHADAVGDYATGLLGRTAGAWRMTGVDPWGADLRLEAEIARLPFVEPVADPEAMRATLVSLVRKARGARNAAE